ncbi:VOC family protein [Microbulbifer yueqingensis]|uniref:Catechol 2,3-dioxygenase n=1 Tax=Microbulbifer yueqingensis TaxID=658219 RepID=A0A1G8XPA2_9GAMM|nr:VOC family protein [Microbulbifer yueqingensis]SDJ91715.1 Catechol 2,3-dioxygenase [Microbulbifer yueqingensis]
MFRIRNIDHIVLRVTDLRAMLAFYVDILGCSVEREKPGIGLYQLRAGGSLIDLVPVSEPLGRAGGAPPGREGRNLDHLCLHIEPFHPQALVRYLRARDIEPGPVETRYGATGNGPSLYIQDPEGNTVELKGSPPA